MNITETIKLINEAFYHGHANQLQEIKTNIEREMEVLAGEFARGTTEYQNLGALHELIVSMQMKNKVGL